MADELREEQESVIRAMHPEERLLLALQLGEDVLKMYQEAHGVTRAEALAVYERSRARDRRGRTA